MKNSVVEVRTDAGVLIFRMEVAEMTRQFFTHYRLVFVPNLQVDYFVDGVKQEQSKED